ncbi:MAG: glycosyltransferase [Hyphomicrobiales bacterium]|nr:glycosyltransferase [Hyphomicrobiales bacterium]
MSRAIDLIKAILREHCISNDAARHVLDASLELEVDPLDYCAHRFGFGEYIVLERAADWVGVQFSAVFPATLTSPQFRNLDALGETRSVRGQLDGREVQYSAPLFTSLLHLKDHLALVPSMRERLCFVPASVIRSQLAQTGAEQLLDASRQRLARLWPHASAHLALPMTTRLAFVAALAALVAIAAVSPFWLTPVLTPLVGAFLVIPALFRLVAALTPTRRHQNDAPPLLTDAELPVYSVLIPLCDEHQMVPLLRRAMAALDYPPEKLDIKFVVEAASTRTIAAVDAVLGDPRFTLIAVPKARPHTKPKALNYALPFVRGQHVVVYDAEDIPDPDQLRLAASRFAADPGLDCLQAELVLDNAAENWLTALFAGEYAGQFGLMLPALARWGLPIPLGGTSNHFRTSALRELGGWDAFNVTEDADLGVRMARLRYRVATFASQTREEAPISMSVWMLQRTRWMKGWMQTFIVHNRDPRRFFADAGWRGALAFEIYVGSLIMSAPLHTIFLAGVLLRLALGGWPVSEMFAMPFEYALIFAFGYSGAVALVITGLLRLKKKRLLAYQLLLPIYWVLHSFATLRACHQLLTRPFFWAKTVHGRTRMTRRIEPADGGLRPFRAKQVAAAAGRKARNPWLSLARELPARALRGRIGDPEKAKR